MKAIKFMNAHLVGETKNFQSANLVWSDNSIWISIQPLHMQSFPLLESAPRANLVHAWSEKEFFQVYSLTQVCLYKLWHFCCATKKCLEVSDAELSLDYFLRRKSIWTRVKISLKHLLDLFWMSFIFFCCHWCSVTQKIIKKEQQFLKLTTTKRKKLWSKQRKESFLRDFFFLRLILCRTVSGV